MNENRLMMDINNPEFGWIRFEAITGLKDSLLIVFESRYLGSTPEFQNRIRTNVFHAVRGKTSVIVDIAGISEMDSSFLGLLLNLRYEVQEKAGCMVLVDGNPDTHRHIDAAGLSAFLPIVYSMEQAYTFLKAADISLSDNSSDHGKDPSEDPVDTEQLEELEPVPEDTDRTEAVREVHAPEQRSPTHEQTGTRLSQSEITALLASISANPEDAELPSRTISRKAYEDLCTTLQGIDRLLEALPDEEIQNFARSELFEAYKSAFEELGIESDAPKGSTFTMSGRLRRHLAALIPYMDSLMTKLPDDRARHFRRSSFARKWRRIRRRYGRRCLPETRSDPKGAADGSRIVST